MEKKLQNTYLTNYKIYGKPLSNLVDNVAKGIHKIKWKLGYDKKIWEV